MQPISALKLSNPVIFSVGMVAHNLSFHVNVIARARARSHVCKRGRLNPAPAPVTKACRESLIAAYEGAGTSGLCAEGRWEVALDSLRSINLSKIIC